MITLHVIRPTETIADAYWPVSTTIDEEHNTLTWDVDDFDTQWPGNGSLSFLMTDVGNTFRLQSATVTTVVIENLALHGTYPLPVIVDATATAADILFPKTAYVNTGKATGSCTFDADTTDATAVESDILLGKTAYVDGEKLTGTSTLNADTTDATLTANDMLYGVTGYGADGTKLTGAGAYWQYVTSFPNFNISGAMPSTMEIYSPLSRSFASYTLSTISNVMDSVLFTTMQTASGLLMVGSNSFFLCKALTLSIRPYTVWVGFTGDVFRNSLIQNLDFEMNMSEANTNLGLWSAFAIQEIRFVPSTIKYTIGIASPYYTTTSLLSIANGLDAAAAPKTLTMHATSKNNMNNIDVDVVDGVAILGTTKTLMQFVNTDKGWTVA